MRIEDDEYEPEDRQLTAEEQAMVRDLSEEQVRAIDSALMAAADRHWRKVAYIVGSTMLRLPREPGIPDVYYAQRVRELVGIGALEAQGFLSRMRYSEVRVPQARLTP